MMQLVKHVGRFNAWANILPSKIARCKYSSWKSSLVVDTNNIIHSPHSDVSIPDLNLSEYVWTNVKYRENLPALTCAATKRSYTFGEAYAASERLSISLPAATGLNPGETLGLVMPNMPEFAITTFGAAAAGLVVSPASPIYTPGELARQLTDSGARAVVTTPALLEKVRTAVELMPGGSQILVATGGGAAEEAALKSQGAGLLSLHELLHREYTRHTPRLPRADPNSIVLLPYSSGTTGLPKGVVLTHRNIVSNLCQVWHPDMLPIYCMEGSQNVSLAVLPFYHIFGFAGVMTVNLCFGRHTVTLPKFEASLFAEAFVLFKPTALSLVPSLLSYIINTNTIPAEDLARVKFVLCGAAPATRPVIEKFVKKINNIDLDFREGFGMTEVPMGLCNPRGIGQRKIGSCGTPLPLAEVKIADEAGNALPVGETGELQLRGPQIMKGYHNNETATKETITDDGWLRTGDVAFVDSDGFIFIVDRMKELIKVKGLQVAPTELESLLRQLDAVVEVAVVGVPDERAGELPRAYVVKKENSNLSENDVSSFIAERVAPFKRLAGGVRFIDAIPRNALGKILRKDLKSLP